MDIQWNSDYVDLQELIDHSRGDEDMMKRYLNQFLELIPDRLQDLTESLATQDRISVRQALHQMNPQIQFFGVSDVGESISQVMEEYEDMDWEELESLAEGVMDQLEDACGEVESVLSTYF